MHSASSNHQQPHVSGPDTAGCNVSLQGDVSQGLRLPVSYNCLHMMITVTTDHPHDQDCGPELRGEVRLLQGQMSVEVDPIRDIRPGRG